MLPKSFKLLAHTWTVEGMHGAFEEDGDLCNGICDFRTLSIRVNIDAAPSLVLHSFWHEVMHALLWSIGHELQTNEGFVDAVGCALAQVLQSAQYAGITRLDPNMTEVSTRDESEGKGGLSGQETRA
jgi:hypothetical protein